MLPRIPKGNAVSVSSPSPLESDALNQLLVDAERLQDCGSWRVDHSDGRMVWSPQLAQMLELDPQESPRLELLLHRVPEEERNLVAASLRQSWLSGRPFRLEHRLHHQEGPPSLVLHRGETVCDSGGKALHSIGILQNLNRLQSLQLELEQATHTDNLTGLPNRLASIEHLAQRIRELPYNRQVALLCLDLDDFQGINDSFGVEMGNQLLQWMAEHLRQRLQASDWLARLDGDSFLVVRSEGLSSLADALQLARQLVASLRQVVPRLDTPLPVQLSACVGISIAPDHGSDPSSLLQWANTALSEAKRLNKGTVMAYSTAISRSIREKLDLEQRLARAIDREELQLHYQPQWDRHHNLIGAEALLRWHTHRGESIPPTRFIPLAEQSGLIQTIGPWVLEQAIQQMSRWIQDGLAIPQLAINISAQQLDGPNQDLDLLLLNLCEQWGVPAQRLELELTETALLSNPRAAAKTLAHLAEAGVSLAIDDFGTGFSSLAILQRLPLQRLKIDRCFVTDLPSNPADRSIVKATILMAHELGLSCLAEGVESNEQHRQLLELGCDSFQGYLFGQPMPAAEMNTLISRSTTGT